MSAILSKISDNSRFFILSVLFFLAAVRADHPTRSEGAAALGAVSLKGCLAVWADLEIGLHQTIAGGAMGCLVDPMANFLSEVAEVKVEAKPAERRLLAARVAGDLPTFSLLAFHADRPPTPLANSHRFLFRVIKTSHLSAILLVFKGIRITWGK